MQAAQTNIPTDQDNLIPQIFKNGGQAATKLTNMSGTGNLQTELAYLVDNANGTDYYEGYMQIGSSGGAGVWGGGAYTFFAGWSLP